MRTSRSTRPRPSATFMDFLTAGRSFVRILLRLSMPVIAAAALVVGVFAGPASANDSPSGFWYGADGSGPGPNGSGVEYTFPNCGGGYGSYVGRIDSYPDSYGNATYSNDAQANANSGYGIGATSYFDLAGPTSDPSYNGTGSEALSWGEQQAATATSNYESFYDHNDAPSDVILWADMESGNGGWGSNQTLNRDVFNGFYDEIRGEQIDIQGSYATGLVGIYTTSDWWSTYVNSSLATVFEWTAQTSHSSYASGDCASGWTSGSYSAVFYASFTTSSACAVMYQYVSGSSDYDQVDKNRIPGSCT